MAPVNIKINAILDNLTYSTEICEIQDTSMTWREVIASIGIPVDPIGKYWVTNSHKTIMMVPDDNVDNFISQYKRKMNPYIIYLSVVNYNTILKYYDEKRRLLDMMPVQDPQPGRPLHQNNEVDDDSNDSYDDTHEVDPNIKEVLSRKLMENFSNGDLTFIKNEFFKMKSEGKMMDSARNIPATLIFLDILFATDPCRV